MRAMLLGQGLRLAAGGAFVGALVVVPSGVLVESLLFEVAPSESWSLAAGATLVLMAAVAACWVPADRAARLDPARVLRGE
jgi:putative ABC transport system permease protein